MIKVSTSHLAPSKGIVYILEIELEEKLIVKIGVTTRAKVEERVAEILISIWKKYRIFPRCYVKRYRHFDNPYAIETLLHNALKDKQYVTKHVFSGSTEMFDVPLELAVHLYEVLYNGGSKDEIEDELRRYTGSTAKGSTKKVDKSGSESGDAGMGVLETAVETDEDRKGEVSSEDMAT